MCLRLGRILDGIAPGHRPSLVTLSVSVHVIWTERLNSPYSRASFSTQLLFVSSGQSVSAHHFRASFSTRAGRYRGLQVGAIEPELVRLDSSKVVLSSFPLNHGLRVEVKDGLP